jgi:NTE family protein
MKKKSVSLALGSGAARGLAHIGILKAFQEANIPVPEISGASMGALIGACFSATGNIQIIEDIALNINWKKTMKLADPSLFLLSKGALAGKKVRDLLKTIIGDITFSDLKIPLSINATDIETGEEVVFKNGSVLDAVMASIAIPGIFVPVKINNRYLMDGGIIDPVPVHLLKKRKNTLRVACNVINDPKKRIQSTRKAPLKKMIQSKQEETDPSAAQFQDKLDELFDDTHKKTDIFQKSVKEWKKKISSHFTLPDKNMPSIFITLLQSYYVMEYEIALLKIRQADAVITPNTSHVAIWEFFRAKEVIDEGYKCAKKFLKEAY